MADKVARINTGLYSVIHAGKVYHVERYPDGAWLVFEVTESDAGGERREYMNDFATKRAAVSAILAGVEA